MNPANASFTHVIVGAGSAGCLLANRLSAHPNNHVLVLEAGARPAQPHVLARLLVELALTALRHLVADLRRVRAAVVDVFCQGHPGLDGLCA